MKNRKTLRRNKQRRRPKGQGRVGLSQSYEYKEVLRLGTYNLAFNEQQEWPVIVRFGAIASTCERLMALATNFQQYKLVSLQVGATPIVRSGNYPPPIYGMASMDRELSPTSSIVIQTGHKFSNEKASSYRLNVRGLQNDFNYWFDCDKLATPDKRPTLQWNFACDTYQSTVTDGVYQLSITANVHFRFPQYDTPTLIKKLSMSLEKAGVEEEEPKEEEEKFETEMQKQEKIKSLENQIDQLRLKLAELNSA